MIYVYIYIYSRTCIIQASINRASQVSLADALNFAETLLEFLDQESDSNFSDILTLRKLRISVE
jgi:hypothetical protein